MADLTVPDISEWQGTPSLTGLPAVIIRGHNGYRPDNTFAANRAAAHNAGCQIIGIYQYMLSTADPAAQARALLQTVGPLQPGEFLICDIEESVSDTADEQPRYQAWKAVAATVSPTVWCYTYVSFAQSHGLFPEWVAEVDPVEPPEPHVLWQFTSGYRWPWGLSDASVFHGTAADLHNLIFPQPAPPAPAPPNTGAPNMVLTDPQTGGVWVADTTGAVFAYPATTGTPAPYLGGSNGAKFGTAGLPCVGIAAYSDVHGDGYLTVHDFGPNSGGAQYRRFVFPRDGSGK